MAPRRWLVVLAAAAPAVACASLLGVEPLTGTDGGSEAGADASPAEGAVSSDASGADAVDAGAAEAPDGVAICVKAWIDASGGDVPPGSVNSEPLGEAGLAIYVCRVDAGGAVVPGKLLPTYGCYYSDGTTELLVHDYQALVPSGCAVAWKASPGGVTPANALACGQDDAGDLFSCRVEEGTYVGELGHMGWGTNHTCFYDYGTQALTASVFDVLTVY
jgi:hypothetical protein